MRKLLKGRRLDDTAERVLFALVANRALAPSSKLAVARDKNGSPVTSGDDAEDGKEAGFRTWGSPGTTATTCPRS
jgi:hypothetical protein